MENQKGLVEIISEKIWKFLSSVKLAVVLLIILAIVSVIGTLIAQNEAPEQYLREYSQATVNLFETLGFFDMYHTWWFVFLLFLLTANLTVCTLDRFPHTWKVITAPLKPLGDEGLLISNSCLSDFAFRYPINSSIEYSSWLPFSASK